MLCSSATSCAGLRELTEAAREPPLRGGGEGGPCGARRNRRQPRSRRADRSRRRPGLHGFRRQHPSRNRLGGRYRILPLPHLWRPATGSASAQSSSASTACAATSRASPSPSAPISSGCSLVVNRSDIVRCASHCFSLGPSPRDVLFQLRHLALHKRIEHRDRECGLAETLAPHHTLVDQLLTDGRDG